MSAVGQRPSSVYDRTVEEHQGDSLAEIAGHIAPGAIVLDLGAATGALGRYLREHKGCTVDGVEQAADAARVARPAYRSLVEADLETAVLAAYFPARAYDAIVCADVLEHLRDPARLLDQIPALLAERGRLLVSIPNVAYAGVIAGLLQGEFRYRPTGLLDTTHVRFFTRGSLLELLRAHGFTVTDVRPLTVDLHHSEFREHPLDALPPAVSRALLAQPDALTYQFIVEAVPHSAQVVDLRTPERVRPTAPHFLCQVYWATEGSEYSEAASTTAFGVMGEDRQTVSLALPALDQPAVRLRFDPSDRPGFLRLEAIRLLDHAGVLAWEWDGDRAALASRAHQMTAFASPFGECWLATGEDPVLELPVPFPALERLRAGGSLAVDLSWPASADFLLATRVLDEHEHRWAGERQVLGTQLGRLEDQVAERRTVVDAALQRADGQVAALRAEASRLAEQLAEQLRGMAVAQQGLRQQLNGLSGRVTVLEAAPGPRRLLGNMVRGLRRRRVPLEVRAGKEVVCLDADAGRWESSGSDPCFELVPCRGAFPTGWVDLDFEVETDVTPVTPPILYVNRGDGYTEASAIRLPRPESGHIRATINLSAVVCSLRFDPLDRPGTFRIGALAVREMAKPEMGLRLVGPVVADVVRHPGQVPAGLRALIEEWRAGGVQALKNRLVESTHVDGQAVRYADWIARFDTLTEADRQAIRQRLAALPHRPLFSIVMPVYDTPERWLGRAIESVRAQLYTDWELCVADDASPAPHVRRVLERAARRDPRIRPVFRPTNGRIAEASNSALAIAHGEFVVLMDSDDEISPHALALVAETLHAHPDADLLYSDEDKIDERGRRNTPYFKPEWNPDLFYAQNYFSHLGVYRTALVRAVGGFRREAEGSQDYDLALRCLARSSPDRICHLPHVLYHWRAIAGSGAFDVTAKHHAHPNAERALRDHFQAAGRSVEVSAGPFPTTYRVRYPLPAEPPLVTLIIPTRDGRPVLERCIESVLARTTYPRVEILVVDNQSRDPATLEYLRRLEGEGRARVLPYDRPFNYSAINNLAARAARGTVLGLLNNDIEVIAPEWLAEMVAHALRPEIGAVGARLLYPNDTVQHMGVVTGLNGVAGHIQLGLPRDAAGYFGRAHLVQAVSAVTGACLVVRRALYEQVGGLDEAHLPIAFNDIDFCLRLEAAGYRNLWTPSAELYHHESFSRGPEDTPEKQLRFQGEIDTMIRRWGARLSDDPYFSPNLSLAAESVEIAWPPRVQKPWRTAT